MIIQLETLAGLLPTAPTFELNDSLLEVVYSRALQYAGRDVELIEHWEAAPDVTEAELKFCAAWRAASDRMNGEG